MKYLLIALVVVLLAVAGFYAFRPHAAVAPSPTPTATHTPAASPTPTPKPARTATPTPTAGLNISPAKVFDVFVQNFSFNPGTLTVKKGDVVVWTNKDQVTHTVTANGGAFTTQLAPGGSFTLDTGTLAAGTYGYHCSIHTTMQGTLVVQ